MLPAALKDAIDRRLEGVSRRELAGRAAAMSEAYRGGRGSGAAIAGEHDITAYLVTRLPATCAATHAALRAVRERLPEFAPATVLDVGCGPGTASWAACAVWPGIEQVTMSDNSALFLNTARGLCAASDHPALRNATFRQEDFTRVATLPPADLVIASYALGEARHTTALPVLWQAATGVLALIEPGTPAGYQTIVAQRAALLDLGAHLAAPCPHELACPIVPPDWCHFSQRLERTRDHIALKAASVPFEDEKFSYVAASRAPPAPITARVLAPPLIGKAGATCKLCIDGRIELRTTPSRDRAAFKAAAKLRWGDGVM